MISISDASSLVKLAISLWEKLNGRNQSRPEPLSFNYIRLFGVHGISRVWLHPNEPQGREINGFLSTWEHAKAGLIFSEPLEWLNGVSILRLILETHPQAILARYAPQADVKWTGRQGGGFLANPEIRNEDLDQFHEPDCWRGDECACFACCPTMQSIAMDHDQNLASLAVAIRNESKEVLKNLKLNYLLVSQSNPGKAESKSRIIPSLTPGQAMVWPLRVYLSDMKGFEARVLSPNVIPQSIGFTLDGGEQLIHVRPPLREAAARVKIPGGWYHQ